MHNPKYSVDNNKNKASGTTKGTATALDLAFIISMFIMTPNSKYWTSKSDVCCSREVLVSKAVGKPASDRALNGGNGQPNSPCPYIDALFATIKKRSGDMIKFRASADKTAHNALSKRSNEY
jgi:hypothetical protein